MKKLTLIGLALFLVSALTQLHAQNLILNPGCEDSLVNGEIPHWIELIGGNWTQRDTDPEPYSGDAYFFPGVASIAELIQDVNVSNYSALIDDSLQFFVFEGYVRSWPQNPPDHSRIVIEYLDATKLIMLDSIDFGNYWTTSSWVQLTDTSFAPSGTRFIRIRLISTRYAGSNNDGYYDALLLRFCELNSVFTASEDTICEGGTVSFTDQSECNVTSWNWTFEGGTPGTSTAQHPSVTYNTMGTFDVQLVVSDGTYYDTLSEEDYINVSNYLVVQPNTPSGPAETCEGGSYDYTTNSVTGATSYEWMLEPSSAGTISGSGTTGTYMAASGWTGAYSVKVRASNVCGTGAWSDTLAANLNHQPLQFNLTGGGPYCEGEPGRELILDSSETGIDYEMFLDDVSTGIILPGTGNALNFGFFTEVGFYTATGYTAYCSQQMAGENYIFIQPLPGQAATPTGPDMVCGSDTSEYVTNGAPDADSLIWILSPTEAGTLMPGDESVEIIWSSGFTGTALLSVYGTNACGDGLLSDSLEITVLLAPAPEIDGPANVCPESTEDYMTIENPDNTYDWEVSGGTIVSGAGTYQISVLWGDPGSGYVMVTEDNGTCSTSTEQFEVVIELLPGIGDNELHNLKVYPNPARNVLYIDLGTIRELKDGMISLINIHGHVINSVKVTEGLRNIRIDITSFAPGLYYVQIVEDGRVIGARKVVIER